MSPSPGPGRCRDPALGAARGAQSRARSPPRHRVRAPPAGRREPQRQPLSSLAHSAQGSRRRAGGTRAGKTRDTRPLTVGAGLRAPLQPGDSRGRTAGAHRGRGAPPGEPRGCTGSSWRRFLLFLSPRRRRRRLLGKRKKERKKRVLGSSCWKVSAKPPPSAAVPPKSLPSPDSRQRRRPGPAAQTLSACSGRRLPGWILVGVSCSFTRHEPPKGRLTSTDTAQKELKPRDFGKVYAVNLFKMVVSGSGRLGL